MVSKKVFSKSFIFSILILLVIGQVTLGQQNSGIQYKETAGLVEITTPELAVKVTANGTVPHFHFWNPNENGSTYHVMFLRLFEVNDKNGDGKYNKSEDTSIGAPLLLPSTNWDLSDFSIEEGPDSGDVQAVHFNFTHSSTLEWSILGVDVYIQLRVHVYAADLNKMKFDLIISGWDWQADDSLLVLQFTVSGSSNKDDINGDDVVAMIQENNQFQFGEGFMEYNEQAQAGNESIQVRGSHGEGLELNDIGKSVYLAFTNFGNETLVYDPTIGISVTDGDTDGGTDGDTDGGTDGVTIGSPAVWIGLIGGISIALGVILPRIRTNN